MINMTQGHFSQIFAKGRRKKSIMNNPADAAGIHDSPDNCAYYMDDWFSRYNQELNRKII
jgi:hypothetical protein